MISTATNPKFATTVRNGASLSCFSDDGGTLWVSASGLLEVFGLSGSDADVLIDFLKPYPSHCFFENGITLRYVPACAADAFESQMAKKPEPVPPPSRQQSLVYFARRSDGMIKIGISVDPQRRIRGISMQSGMSIEILRTVAGGRPLEALLHARFAAARTLGEWFEPVPELLAHIDSLAASEAA